MCDTTESFIAPVTNAGILENLSEHEALVPLSIIFGTGLVIAVVAIIFDAVRGIMVGCDREKSRREIAAYVAEGSMTPEEAERVLRASPSDRA